MKLNKQIGFVFVLLLTLVIFKNQAVIKASDTDDIYYFGQTETTYDGQTTAVITSDNDIKQTGTDYQYDKPYENVSKLIFNEGVTKISSKLMSHFPNVEEIVIPASATSIYCSEKNTRLATFDVAEENTVYQVIDGVLYKVDGSVLRIAWYPIPKTDTEYVLPEKASLIKSAISNEYVTKITIGKNNASDFYFNYTIKVQFPNLSDIEITSENTKYCSKDGVVFTKDGTSLIAYPAKGGEVYTIPDGTKTVEHDAFSNTNIKNVTFSKDTKTLRSEAFYPTSLESVTMPDNGLTYIGIWAFHNTKLTSVVLPEGLIRVNDGAFSGTPLVSVTFPSTLKTIECCAFEKTSLTKLVLPKGLATVYPASFDADEITSIKLASGNTSLCLYNGVLYNKAKTKLVWWPSYKKVTKLTFPSTLQALDVEAVCKKSGATSIVIPKAMKTLTNCGTNTLKTITIASGNKYFVVKNNVLYKKDMSGLALYPLKSTAKNVTLAAGLTKLSMTVFGYMNNNIVTLTLPKSLKSITSYYGYGNIPASGFVKLTTIKVVSGSKYFKSQNGILYNKSMTKLYWFPINKNITTYTVPATVTQIRNASLAKQNYLKTITISAKCTDIDQQIEGCYDNVFYPGLECPKLEAINFKSTKAGFRSGKGIVYTKNWSTLVYYPPKRTNVSYTLAPGCKYITCELKNAYLQSLTLASETYVYFEAGLDNMIMGLTALKEISVPKDNVNVESIDGVVYSKEDNAEMLLYPVAKTDTTLVLPDNFRSNSLPELALNSKYLTTLKVSDTNAYYYVENNSLYRNDGTFVFSL